MARCSCTSTPAARAYPVPERLRADPKLVLRFGYQLTPTILDLDIGAEALSGTLSFGGVPHRCVLPWGAVYAVVSEGDQRGMVWPDDVPPEAMDLGDEGDEPADLEAEPEAEPTSPQDRPRSPQAGRIAASGYSLRSTPGAGGQARRAGNAMRTPHDSGQPGQGGASFSSSTSTCDRG